MVKPMELNNLPHQLTTPIYGLISHYYLDSTLNRGEYKTLQALAVIEAVAPRVSDFTFCATSRDFARLTNLTEATIWKALSLFELGGLLERTRRNPHPSVFYPHWEKSLLPMEATLYLTDYQLALREYAESKKN